MRSIALAVAVACLSASCANTDLFLPDEAPASIRQAPADVAAVLVVRERTARLNEGYFFDKAFEPASAEAVRFNLFEDVSFEAVAASLEDRLAGIRMWTGRTEDGDVVRLALAVQGRRVTGEILRGERSYRIAPLAEPGWYRIVDIDPSRLPPEAPYLESGRPEDAAEIERALRDCDSYLPFPGPKGSRIHVHVAYSWDVAEKSTGIAADIALLMDQLAQLWTRSPHFHTVAEFAGSTAVPYRDSGSMALDLDRLTRPDDGVMDELHAVRERTKADLVVLLVEKADFCGKAWRPSLPLDKNDAVYGFSVVRRECGLSNLSFAHEIGHNLGMRHDRYVERAAGGHEFGYANHTLRFRSVMAYDDDCVRRGYSCRRVPHYSSPHVTFKRQRLGEPIGTPGAAHNMNVLCASSSTVADFRK